MSGEHAFLPAISAASAAREVPEAMPAANPAKVAELRQLVDQLRLAGTGPVDPKTARLAANELAELADALEAGGAVANGYAVVPLLESGPQPPPFAPPEGEP